MLHPRLHGRRDDQVLGAFQEATDSAFSFSTRGEAITSVAARAQEGEVRALGPGGPNRTGDSGVVFFEDVLRLAGSLACSASISR